MKTYKDYISEAEVDITPQHQAIRDAMMCFDNIRKMVSRMPDAEPILQEVNRGMTVLREAVMRPIR